MGTSPHVIFAGALQFLANLWGVQPPTKGDAVDVGSPGGLRHQGTRPGRQDGELLLGQFVRFRPRVVSICASPPWGSGARCEIYSVANRRKLSYPYLRGSDTWAGMRQAWEGEMLTRCRVRCTGSRFRRSSGALLLSSCCVGGPENRETDLCGPSLDEGIVRTFWYCHGRRMTSLCRGCGPQRRHLRQSRLCVGQPAGACNAPLRV